MAPLQRLSCPALLVLVSALVAGTDESGHCPDRQRDAGVLLLPEADVFLGAFVQAHAPARDALLGCAGPLAPGVELLEVFKWAVALLNRDQGFVPGIKIGEGARRLLLHGCSRSATNFTSFILPQRHAF